MRLIPCDVAQGKLIDRSLFNRIVEIAFHQRRKTIKNNLASIASESQLQQALIDPSLRPQEISIRQYITLTNQLSN